MSELKFIDIAKNGSVKGINFDAFGGIETFLRLTSNGGSDISAQLRRVVPWLAKAQDMTALAASELPFDVLNDRGDVVDTSIDWQNKIGGMPSPSDLFYKLASSLCVGRAYVIPTVTSRMVVDLQYCAPHTVNANITTAGIVNFQRTTDKGKNGLYYPAGAPEPKEPEIMYFWLPDSDVEIGPAESFPAGTALLSSQMLVNIDSTISTIAGRGFISPTVLMAKGMNDRNERERAEGWWNRFLRGWTENIAKILNGDAMTALKIGAGMDELRGVYPELSKQAIENIGTAYGIPAALFMSDMAFASEVDALIKVWYTTSQFVKIYRCIETTFNTQLLNRWKLTLKFRPETLDAFQPDKKQVGELYKLYKDAGIKPSIAAQLANVKLPEGIEPEDLDPEEVPEPLAPMASPQAAPMAEDKEPMTLDADMVKDLNLWRQVAVRRMRQGQGCAADWESKVLPDEITEGIRARLVNATTEAQVVKAFEISAVSADPMLAELKRSNDLLETLTKEK